MSDAVVHALHRYPVKGLSPEPLARVALAQGETMPLDRAWAIENGASGFDPADPRHLPKIRFLMLMRNGRLAGLHTRLDPDSRELTITRDGAVLARGHLDTTDGRAAIEAFLATFCADELRGPPRILVAPGFSFSDVPRKVLHVINLASVRALEAFLGRPVDPLRFRANVHVDGLPAWGEVHWVGARVAAPGVVLSGVKRTERCAATNVDPLTGERDLEIPRALMGLFGHTDFGIYMRVETDGHLAVGDTLAGV